MNTVDFDLQYAPDDRHALLTGDDTASRTHVNTLSFTVADKVTGNKQDITDRNLDEPIQARYIKLNVTKAITPPGMPFGFMSSSSMRSPASTTPPPPMSAM